MPRTDDLNRAARTTNDTGRGRAKLCLFCTGSLGRPDYKDVKLLRRFMSDRGRIRARAATGNCAQHQRDIATAVKIARELSLLPYASRALGDHGRRGSRAAAVNRNDLQEVGV